MDPTLHLVGTDSRRLLGASAPYFEANGFPCSSLHRLVARGIEQRGTYKLEASQDSSKGWL
jgi:hypothetical protein